MTDLIIIGAGTAGLTAAIYAARAGLTTKIIEKAFYGGQVVTTPSVENYPGMPGVNGADFAMALHKQVKDLDVQILYETVKSAQLSGDIKNILTTKNNHQAKTVIIATGASPRKLGVPGEDKWLGHSVVFCATCDGARFRDKEVAVIGGGNVAIEDALLLSDLCKSVTVIHRSANFSSEQKQLEKVKAKSNVKFVLNSVVKELLGDDSFEKVRIENTLTGQVTEIAVDGIFVAIGSEPDNSVFAEEINLDKYGYVIAGEDCITNLPGVFVAGDTRTKQVRQLVTAAADGAVAALAAKKYIGE